MKNKRNKRINSKYYYTRLDSFYKVITNSKMTGRGSEIIVIKPETFYRIAITIQKLQTVKRPKVGYVDIAQVLNCIRTGDRFSNSNFPVSKYILTSYLTAAVESLKLQVKNHKITLNTIYTSGKMNETARQCNFDIEYECKYYDIPII